MKSKSPSDAIFTEIWRDAVSAFEKQAEMSLKDVCLPSPQSVKEFVRSIEENHSRYIANTEHGKKTRAALMTVLTPVAFFGDIVGAGLSTVYPPTQAIFGAVKYLFDTAKNVSHAYGAITELFESMQSFSHRLELYANHKIPPMLRVILASLLKTYLEIFAISIKRMKSNRTSLFLYLLVGNDQGINAAIIHLGQLIEDENKALVALIYDSTVDIPDVLIDMKEQLNRIAEHLGVNSLNRLEQHVLQGDDTPEFPSADIFEDLAIKTLEHTGIWVQTEREFIEWAHRRTPLLWIAGAPGVGRSFLAYSIIEYLKELYPENPASTAATSVIYFCDPDRQLLLSINTLIRSVAYQIAKFDKAYYAQVEKIPGLNHLHNASFLWEKLITKPFTASKASTVFIVIYGLDQVKDEERKSFLDVLGEFERTAHEDVRSRVSILFISTPRIGTELKTRLGVDIPHIEVSPAKTKNDIDRYIEWKVGKEIPYVQTRKTIRLEIIESLRNHANGSFLWVDTMIKALESKHENIYIRDILQNAPKTWQDTFLLHLESLAGSLTDEEIEDLNYMLPWILLSVSPLSLRALGQALLIRTDGGRHVWDLIDLVQFHYGLLFYLTTRTGSLLAKQTDQLDLEDQNVVKSLKIPTEDDEDGNEEEEEDEEDEDEEYLFVSVRHAAIRNLFLSGRLAFLLKIRMNPPEASAMVLRTCLQVFCDKKKFERCQDSLAYYAAQLHQHFEKADRDSITSEDRREVIGLLVRLFSDAECFSRWIDKARPFLSEHYLYSRKFVTTVVTWITDSDVSPHLEQIDSTKNWIQRLKSSPIETLFKGIADECGRRWMHGSSNHFGFELMFFHNYLLKVENPDLEHPLLDLRRLTTERILELAGKLGCNGTDSNHLHRVAIAFLKSHHIQEATSYARAALSADPRNGKVMITLAEALIRSNEVAEACTLLHTAQTLFTDADINEKLTTFEALYKYGATPIPNPIPDPSDIAKTWFVEHRLDSFLRTGDYTAVTPLLQRLVSPKLTPAYARTWLRFFQELSMRIPHHQRLILYALKTSQRGLVDELYKRALGVLGMCQVGGAGPVVRYFYATLYIRLNLQAERARRLLEQVVKDFESLKEAVRPEYQKVWYCAEIDARLGYLVDGLKKRPMVEVDQDAEFEEYFRALAAEVAQADHPTAAALPLAVWFREKKRPAELREAIGRFMTEALLLVESEESAKKWRGWYMLSDALTAVGAEEQAIQALGYIKQSRLLWVPLREEDNVDEFLEKSPFVRHDADASAKEVNGQPGDTKNGAHPNGQPDVNASPIKANEQRMDVKNEVLQHEDDKASDNVQDSPLRSIYGGFTCESCGRLIMTTMGNYRCTTCINVDFCNHCRKVLQGGEMPLKVCDKTHKLLPVPPVYIAYEPGKIRLQEAKEVKGDVGVGEWLEAVRRTWIGN